MPIRMNTIITIRMATIIIMTMAMTTITGPSARPMRRG